MNQATTPQEPAQPALSENLGTANEETEDRSLGRIVFHSLCSAACAVVPVPFLDDHLVKLTRRRMVREMAAERGLQMSAVSLATLSGTQPNTLGCGCLVGVLVSMAFKVVVKILRRIFRTILFWLLAKDAADAASRTFHEGYLVNAALDRAAPRADTPEDIATFRRLRVPVDAALARTNTQALSHVFTGVLAGSRKLLRGLAWSLSKLTGLRRESDDGEETLERELESAIPKSLVDRVAHKLLAQGEYLRRLDELLAEKQAEHEAEQDQSVPSDAADPT